MADPMHNLPDTGFVMSEGMYKKAKWLVTVVLPAIATLYIALSALWGLPEPEKVVGTITAINFFLGVLLGISTKSYNNSDVRFDGSLDVTIKPDGDKVAVLGFDKVLPHDVDKLDQLTLKVNTVQQVVPDSEFPEDNLE
jgi:hypothetical protein